MVMEKVRSKVQCPYCQSPSGVPIVYGPPTHQLFLRAKRGEVCLGGWHLERKNRYCMDCGHDWMDRDTPLECTGF